MKRLTPGMFAAVLIAFFTFAAAAVISRTFFERLPHLEDEFAYLYQAKIFAGGHAWVPRDEPVKVFWQPFVIQPTASPDGVLKRFGKYTPGWPLLLSIGVLAGQPWVINAFLAMLTVALVYRMGSEIFGEPVGLVSALLLAISPMALLLNATLMSHISAMFMAALFAYAYWRVTRHGKRRYVWAAVGGLALGWIIATRPLTAIAIAAPVALHALSRLIDVVPQGSKLGRYSDFIPPLAVVVGILFGWLVTGELISPLTIITWFVAYIALQLVVALSGHEYRAKFGKVFMPLVVLAVFVLPTGGLWALFNQILTGDWRTNTYTLLWAYDQVGFGPNHGNMPGGHSLELGLRDARADLAVWLRDLFGVTLHPAIAGYAADNLGWGAGVGLSWVVVLIGLISGRKNEWVWLFFEFFVAIVIAQLFYWIGSVVYGTAAYSLRYYYEGTFGVCLVAGYGLVAWGRSFGINRQKVPAAASQPTASLPQLVRESALPIDYLNGPSSGRARRVSLHPATFVERLRLAWDSLWPGYMILYIVLVVGCTASLAGYTPARFQESLAGWPNGLFRYNKVGRNQIDVIQAMRVKSGHPELPVLIVVLNDPNPAVEDNWRDYGAAMALTSPYLDSDIILARVFTQEDVPDFIRRFPGRQVLYQVGEHLYLSMDEALAGASQ